MSLLWAGFILGLAGSMHCILMCGPLAGSALSLKYGNLSAAQSRFLYQAGRILSYLAIGLIFGAFGQLLSMVFYQQILSVVSGSLLVVWALFHLFRFHKGSQWAMKFWSGSLSGQFAKLWKKKTPLSVLGLGILNGFLPCGLVYMAATASLNKGNMGYSILFMLFFGLGTLPAMVGIAWSKNLFPQSLRLGFRRMMPVFLGLMGFFFILRGMDLNIPYVSPHIVQAGGCMPGHSSTIIPVCR